MLRHDVADKEMVSVFDYARGMVVETDMPERFRRRPVTVGTGPEAESEPPAWDPARYAARYAFGRRSAEGKPRG